MNSTINRVAFGIMVVLVVAWGLSGSAIAAEQPANQTEINLESISGEDGSIIVAEEEKVNLSQDELVVESGETVVIESRNTTTPTDFVIHKNGTLRIKNSDIFMTGEFHHDNYFDVSGTLILSNSTINGTHGALPGISVWSSNSEVRIDNSTVKGNVGLLNGDAVIENASVGAASQWLDPSKNLTFIAHNSSFETITMRFSHFSQQIEFHNLSSNITNYALHIEGNDLNISNSIIQKSISLDFQEKNPEGEKANYLITNSTDTGITAHPGTNTTIKDSKLFSLYLKHVHSDDTFTYSNVSPGHFTNKSLIDKSNFAVNLENTTVGTKSPDGVSSGLNLVAQGMSARMIIRDSTLGEAKIGRYLNASNISVGAFTIYSSHGGSFHFDNSTVKTFAGVDYVKATVTGNLSIRQSGPEYFVQRWGGLRLLNLTRQYPVDLSEIASEEPDGEQIRVIVQNPNGTEIENTSYDPGTEIVFPKVRYNLSNYNQNFTLTIQQGNRSTSRPLTLTTDTPIHVDLSSQQLSVTDLDAPKEVKKGEEFEVNGNIENTGEHEGTQTVTLTIGDEVAMTTTLTLEGGESEPVSFNVSVGTAGDYTIEVATDDDSEIAALMVESDSRSVVDEYDTNGEEGIQAEELATAFGDWQAGDLDSSGLQAVFEAWQSA